MLPAFFPKMSGGLTLPDFSTTIGVKPSLYIPVFVQIDTP